ncbi:hypothetical protein CRYUN_Cryun27aG0007600 [Craigia yunnanensis]
MRKKLGFDEGSYVEPEWLSGAWHFGGRMVYGAPIFEDRKKVWEYIKSKVAKSEGPLMCIGNSNAMFGVKGVELIKERLDRALINLKWMEEFPNIQVTNLHAMGSDHSPIVMTTDYKDIKNGRRFKFEASWLTMEECESVINEGWSRKMGGI